MDFRVPLGVAFGVDFRRFAKKIEQGHDFGAILGRIFAGSTFSWNSNDFRGRLALKIKQNHSTVIKNQGFAEASQIRFGVRSFMDFGVTLGRFGEQFGAPE